MKFNRSTVQSICVHFTLLALLTGASIQTVFANRHKVTHTPHPAHRERAASKNSSARQTPAERRAASSRELPRGRNARASQAALKREHAAQMQRLLAQRRAETARMAAVARQRSLDEGMRGEVQSFIDRDNTTGEDPEVRRAAVNALGNHAGTVVVMDPATGRVYSIVNQEWALRRGFKPCSTIKLVTGLAGLNERIIDPVDTTNISDTNRIGLTDALAYSNNTYFQQVGGRVGYDKMVSYARRLGLGEKTGINAPNEAPGQVPSPRSGYAVNHMSSHGDDFKVTAVQLATLVSAMANGGRLLSPNIPRSSDTRKIQTKVRRVLNLDLNSLRYMVPGMVGAVNYGSGRRAQNPQETVAGKTGTCIENGTWIGLFASYAPLVNPRLAIVVIARGADAHSHFPAAVAGRIYRELNGRFGTPTNLQIANARKAIDDPKAALNEEDSDDEASDSVEASARTISAPRRTTSSPRILETSMSPVITASPATRNSQANWREGKAPTGTTVKRVLMTIPSRPSETRTVAPKPESVVAPPPQTRPRRVNDLQR